MAFFCESRASVCLRLLVIFLVGFEGNLSQVTHFSFLFVDLSNVDDSQRFWEDSQRDCYQKCRGSDRPKVLFVNSPSRLRVCFGVGLKRNQKDHLNLLASPRHARMHNPKEDRLLVTSERSWMYTFASLAFA